MKARILIIDDEESIRFTFESFLADEGHRVDSATGCTEALSRMDETEFDLVFADIILEDGSGIDLLREIRDRKLACPMVMITGAPSLDTASEAVRLGAFDYITKPVTQERLLRVTDMALRHKALQEEKEKYRANLEAIFRSVKDPIITVDRDLMLVEVNDAVMRICGFDRSAIGKPFGSLPKGCNGRCMEVLEETLRRKEPDEAYRNECRFRVASRYVVTLNTYPLLDPHGSFTGVVMVIRDESRLAELEGCLQERQRFHHMVGKCGKMQRVFSLIEALTGAETTVLVTGESGTGKELAAEALHFMGPRGHKPLVKVNCSALPESLLESELFGHARRAFTGAYQDNPGRFQRAHSGTIFLEEIGDISPKIQAKLLRVLQEKEFERVGDPAPIRVDVRIVAATNKVLQEKVRLGEFREDLFYRLNVVEVAMPPLRERREDIPLLVSHLLEKLNRKFGKKILGITAEVQDLFMSHPWPGNVRQLENALEHAFVLCCRAIITVGDLPGEFMTRSLSPGRNSGDRRVTELETILGALEKAGWNKAKAARILGIDRKTLYRKLTEFGIVGPIE